MGSCLAFREIQRWAQPADSHRRANLAVVFRAGERSESHGISRAYSRVARLPAITPGLSRTSFALTSCRFCKLESEPLFCVRTPGTSLFRASAPLPPQNYLYLTPSAMLASSHPLIHQPHTPFFLPPLHPRVSRSSRPLSPVYSSAFRSYFHGRPSPESVAYHWFVDLRPVVSPLPKLTLPASLLCTQVPPQASASVS